MSLTFPIKQLDLSPFSVFTMLPTAVLRNYGFFLGVRSLSVIGGAVAGLALYIYWFKKGRKDLGLVSSLCFWMLPLSIFYSRMGVPVMFALGLTMSAIVVFENIDNKRMIYVKTVFGLLMLLSILTYPNILSLHIGFLSYRLFRNKKDFKKYVFFAAILLAILVIFGIIFSVLNLILEQKFNDIYPLKNLLWYISWPLVGLTLYGIWSITVSFYKKQNLLAKLFSFPNKRNTQREVDGFIQWITITIPVFPLLILKYRDPQYFLLLMPLIAVLAAIGWKRFFSKRVAVLLIILVLRSSYVAWSSTNHFVGRELRDEINHIQKNHLYLPIYTNLDYKALSLSLNKPVRKLSSKANDGGIIVIGIFEDHEISEYDVKMTNTISEPPDKKRVWMFTDIESLFPYTSKKSIYSIYLITENSSFEDPVDMNYYLPFN
jgi:hypothetical protein